MAVTHEARAPGHTEPGLQADWRFRVSKTACRRALRDDFSKALKARKEGTGGAAKPVGAPLNTGEAMQHAHSVRPAGAWSGEPADTVVLDYDDRYRRRTA